MKPAITIAILCALAHASAPAPAQGWKPNQWEADYLGSADYIKFLRAEEAKLRPALIDLGLAK